MDIDKELQSQSKLLLQKLKARQGKLQNILKNQTNTSRNSDESRELETSTSALQQSLIKSALARERLAKYKVSSKENYDSKVVKQGNHGNKDGNLDIEYKKAEMKDKSVLYKKSLPSATTVTTDDNRLTSQNSDLDKSDETPLKSFVQAEKGSESVEEYMSPSERVMSRVETPNTVRRRKIIDKNVKVGSDLNESELDTNNSRLNFSYSKFNDSDLEYLQSKLQTSPEEVLGTGRERFDGDIDDEDTAIKLRYKSRLADAGNDRKVAAVAREACKPKSILNSNGPKDLKKVNLINIYSKNDVHVHIHV